MTLNVKQVGGSFAIVIPKSLANQLGLEKGSELEVTTAANSITLTKPGRRARRPIAELVKQMSPAAYKKIRDEFAADVPVGKEIW